MKMLRIVHAAGLVCGMTSSIIYGQTPGEAVVRIDDPVGSHCIDSTSEEITIFVRRVFVERRIGLFTADNRAGVLIRSSLSGVSLKQVETPPEAKAPSVDMVSIKDEPRGRVSLALEYAIAADLPLTQQGTRTNSMTIKVNLAKAKGRSSFGQVLDIAGKALSQLPIPANPYSQAASKYLQFANETIDDSIKTDSDDEIADLGLHFHKGFQPDLNRCKTAGDERTGAIAVLRSVGAGNDLIPTTNTNAQYCFSYSADATYELLAAKRLDNGKCPDPVAYHGVMNDYVLMLLSAQPTAPSAKGLPSKRYADARQESIDRCQRWGLPATACGVH